MSGMGKFQQAVRKGNTVDERLKYLVKLKGGQMIGCEFCVDLGSEICRHFGLPDEELLALPLAVGLRARRNESSIIGVRLDGSPGACRRVTVNGGAALAQGREDRRRSAAEPRTGAPLTASRRPGHATR
ncbi:MAG: carboxymuconolactone decarboxylase family protein, partial [Acidimicrobiales bacterium]